jgi:cytochrome c oxidase assembly protein subunit 15
MNRLRSWALAATLATFFLIFVGGLVRVSGAGLGCPDWPKCFDRWIPPTSVEQLPPHIDPSTFNVTLAWIEYINRLIGVTIGLLILITAILAIRHARRHPRILYPALLSLVLVAFEGWQGGEVVGTKLAPFVVTVHMVIAFILASVLIHLTLQIHWQMHPPAPDARARAVSRWTWPLWIIAIVSVGMGTQIRSDIETLAANNPNETLGALMNQVGWIKLGHPLIGGALLIATWWVGLRIIWKSGIAMPLVQRAAWAFMILSAAQMFLGLVLVAADMPAALRVLHLWLSSFYVGALVVLQLSLRRLAEGHHG